jgi:hypothetical protein
VTFEERDVGALEEEEEEEEEDNVMCRNTPTPMNFEGRVVPTNRGS